MYQFNVKARVLLELGAELISSDEVALYELIKNAVDAKTEKVIIRVFSWLKHSDYLKFQSEIKANGKPLTRAVVSEWIQQYISPEASELFKSGLLDTLSRVGSEEALLLLRDAYSNCSYLEVEDFGDGMTKDSLVKNFLTVGTPNRVGKAGSKYLGEKGIGRLSAMRLGRRLVVTTTTIRDKNFSRLGCDWGALEDNVELDISEFHPTLESLSGEKDKEQGTKITVSDLQSDWSEQTLRRIARTHLSKLQDPFDRNSIRLDIRLFFNGDELRDAFVEIDQDWLKGWHGYLEMEFFYKSPSGDARSASRKPVPVLKGKAIFRVPSQGGQVEEDSKEIFAEGDGLYSMLADENVPMVPGLVRSNAPRYAGIDTLGPFSMKGYWYNRQRKGQEISEKDARNDFKEWLELWGGGLLVYRDGYRVYPYASPEDDWLSLDQRALRRRSFKLNRGQFVGYVRIGSETNPALKDQTNREGMRDSPEKRALIQCLQQGIWKELGSRVSAHEERSTRLALNSVQKIDQTVKEKSKSAKASLTILSKKLPESDASIRELRSHIDQLELAWAHAKSTIRKQQEGAETYVHLAGVGMLVEFIVHELARTAKYTLGDLDREAKAAKLSPTLRSLQQQLKTLEKRLRILDPVSTPGRQVKSDCDVLEVIDTLISAHEAQFERHKIRVEFERGLSDSLVTHVVPGQIFQIFENLISNSVYWLSTRDSLVVLQGAEQVVHSAITVEYDLGQKTIDFIDNGPGIEEQDADKIFDPFWSKKPASAGRGLGLYITKRLSDDNSIKIELLWDETKDVYNGFRFKFS
ncbi:sensor histidine kinase [Paraburkholderia tropica]|uniref:sensor histidine kinase n=1 Tax=Paraburkholderia tropica TaxID=92647 RepID=UPI002AB65FD8|nr:sensor histidine kinase [Paraburkholderia tropica]